MSGTRCTTTFELLALPKTLRVFLMLCAPAAKQIRSDDIVALLIPANPGFQTNPPDRCSDASITYPLYSWHRLRIRTSIFVFPFYSFFRVPWAQTAKLRQRPPPPCLKIAQDCCSIFLPFLCLFLWEEWAMHTLLKANSANDEQI